MCKCVCVFITQVFLIKSDTLELTQSDTTTTGASRMNLIQLWAPLIPLGRSCCRGLLGEKKMENEITALPPGTAQARLGGL